ncbi:MAG: amidase [Pontimonas sp.]|nr:amidase [Pontimonas sp.]
MSLPHEFSARELVSRRQSGELSATEVVEHFLARIDAKNPVVNALVTTTPERALEHAAAMDLGERDPGILWGLPFADKDLTNRAGVHTGAGSRVMSQAPPATESDPMALAMDNAGGISIGKSAVCEFGLSSYTESLVFSPTLNPYSPDHGSGGSSGGAAAAVAGRLVPVSPGSDGGGSVRIPAWACGVVGLKPSRGLIPGGTGFEYVAGLVVPGPLATNVGDAALLLDALRGPGRTHRATHPGGPQKGFGEIFARAPGPLRIGVTLRHPWEDFVDTPLDASALNAYSQVRSLLEELGHTVVDLGWDPQPGYPEAFTTIWKASAVGLDLNSEQRELLEPLTRYLVEEGDKLSAKELATALRALSAFEEHTIRSFSEVDVVLTPGLATAPPPIGFYDSVDPRRNFAQQVQVTPYSSFVNVAGLPALALPVMLNPDGLPVGVHLIGAPGGDGTLLQLGHQLEEALGFHPGSAPQRF